MTTFQTLNSFLIGAICSGCSCVALEVSDNIISVFGVGNTSEGHGVTGCVVSGGLEVLSEVSVGPLLSGDSLKGTTKNSVLAHQKGRCLIEEEEHDVH